MECVLLGIVVVVLIIGIAIVSKPDRNERKLNRFDDEELGI